MTRLEPLLHILDTQPLTVLFGIHNPARATHAKRVPIPLAPLGYFVRMRILDQSRRAVWESEPPKIHLKLDPAKPEGYRTLDPGSVHGHVFDLSEVECGPGLQVLEVAYSNRQFTGPSDDPIGELGFRLELPLQGVGEE